MNSPSRYKNNNNNDNNNKIQSWVKEVSMCELTRSSVVCAFLRVRPQLRVPNPLRQPSPTTCWNFLLGRLARVQLSRTTEDSSLKLHIINCHFVWIQVNEEALNKKVIEIHEEYASLVVCLHFYNYVYFWARNHRKCCAFSAIALTKSSSVLARARPFYDRFASVMSVR